MDKDEMRMMGMSPREMKTAMAKMAAKAPMPKSKPASMPKKAGHKDHR